MTVITRPKAFMVEHLVDGMWQVCIPWQYKTKREALTKVGDRFHWRIIMLAPDNASDLSVPRTRVVVQESMLPTNYHGMPAGLTTADALTRARSHRS